MVSWFADRRLAEEAHARAGKSLTPVGKVREFNDMLRTKYATEMGGASSIAVLREKLPNLPELDAYYAKVVEPDVKAELTLKLISPTPSNWLDRKPEKRSAVAESRAVTTPTTWLPPGGLGACVAISLASAPAGRRRSIRMT